MHKRETCQFFFLKCCFDARLFAQVSFSFVFPFASSLALVSPHLSAASCGTFSSMQMTVACRAKSSGQLWLQQQPPPQQQHPLPGVFCSVPPQAGCKGNDQLCVLVGVVAGGGRRVPESCWECRGRRCCAAGIVQRRAGDALEGPVVLLHDAAAARPTTHYHRHRTDHRASNVRCGGIGAASACTPGDSRCGEHRPL